MNPPTVVAVTANEIKMISQDFSSCFPGSCVVFVSDMVVPVPTLTPVDVVAMFLVNSVLVLLVLDGWVSLVATVVKDERTVLRVFPVKTVLFIRGEFCVLGVTPNVVLRVLADNMIPGVTEGVVLILPLSLGSGPVDSVDTVLVVMVTSCMVLSLEVLVPPTGDVVELAFSVAAVVVLEYSDV